MRFSVEYQELICFLIIINANLDEIILLESFKIVIIRKSNPMSISNEILKNFAFINLIVVFIQGISKNSADSNEERKVHKFSKLFEKSILVTFHKQKNEIPAVEKETPCHLYTEIDLPSPLLSPPPEENPTCIDLPRPPSGFGPLENMIFEEENPYFHTNQYFKFEDLQYQIPPPLVFRDSEHHLAEIENIQFKTQKMPIETKQNEGTLKITYLKMKPKNFETGKKPRLIIIKNSKRMESTKFNTTREDLHAELKKAISEGTKKIGATEEFRKGEGDNFSERCGKVGTVTTNARLLRENLLQTH